MLQFKAPQDLNYLPNSHPAYPLVQYMIDRLTANLSRHTATASLTPGLR